MDDPIKKEDSEVEFIEVVKKEPLRPTMAISKKKEPVKSVGETARVVFNHGTSMIVIEGKVTEIRSSFGWPEYKIEFAKVYKFGENGYWFRRVDA